MLISVAIKLLLIFIIPISASSVPLEIGYISTGSSLSDPELDIAVQAIKKVEELKILPGISLSLKVIVGEPWNLLNNLSTSFVALFGASSNLKSVKVVTNEWNKPIIIHGLSKKEIVKDSSVLNASPSSAQFAESLLTILEFRQVKLFSIVMEVSEDWKEIASKMESLASFKKININRIKSIPGFDPLSEPSNSDEAWQNVIADTHCDTNVYVFLGKFINLIQFTTAMQKMDLLKSHYILAGNLEANCFENGSSQYLSGSTPGTMGAVEIVAPSCLVSSRFSSIKSENLTLTPSLLLKQPLRSVFVPHLYDGILLYAHALRLVLQQYFVKGNQDPVQLAANASSIFHAIAFLQNCQVVPHFHEAITCNNSLTVAVPTPDNMFENGHSQRYIYQVVSIEQHRHSGASLVFNGTSMSENYLASRDELCRFPVNHSLSFRWSVGEWFLSLAVLLFVSLSTLLLMIGPPVWMRRRMPHSQSVLATGKFSFDPITRKSKKTLKFNDVLESNFCLTKLDNMVHLTVPLEFNILRSHIPNRHYRRLSEILGDPSVEIDQILRNSWIQELLFVLIRLQILGLCHGNLKSSNCLITSRWQLEVTRFELPVESDKDYYTNLLWKAPELLREPSAVPTIQSDVYAFGILVHELVHRRGPFGVREDGHDPSEVEIKTIICKVKEGPTSYESKPVRPKIDRGPDYLEDCWHEYPGERPDFLSLNDRHSRAINQTEDANSDCDIENPRVVDFMIDEVKNVTSDVINSDSECRILEQSVKRREKQLYDVLPKYAAESIMLNVRVEPKEFPCVAILFGHIMNLEELSVNRSPEELYHLLRRVSNGFTSIARKYQVLRLEAVNEDYVVASWPELVVDPKRTFTEEIALMALELKSHFQNYQISLNSGSTLRFSIGIHTGPAAGGVIGLYRPHYHLFGKVVNVASRLSTLGEPGRIHISYEFNDMLKEIREFETVLRGTIPVKGFGEMSTYWLEE